MLNDEQQKGYKGSKTTVREVRPEFIFVRIETTQYWNEGFLAENKVKKTWDVHLYDYREHTHLCEFTPSYCLWYADFSVEFEDDITDDEREEAYDKVQEGACHTEPVAYYHVSTIDAMSDEDKDTDNPFDEEDWNTDEGYKELIESFLEGYRGNPSL